MISIGSEKKNEKKQAHHTIEYLLYGKKSDNLTECNQKKNESINKPESTCQTELHEKM